MKSIFVVTVFVVTVKSIFVVTVFVVTVKSIFPDLRTRIHSSLRLGLRYIQHTRTTLDPTHERLAGVPSYQQRLRRKRIGNAGGASRMERRRAFSTTRHVVVRSWLS